MDALMKPVSRLANPVEWNGMKFRSKLESLVARELLKAGKIGYQTFTINGRCLGYGDPIRVKEGQRVMFRIPNASAANELSST